jgi:hypothetical protein
MKRILKFSAVAAVAGMLAVTASAHTIATLSNGILDPGESAVDQITIGDKTFGDFGWSPIGPAPAADINVSLAQAGLNYYIQFQGPIFANAANPFVDYGLTYSVTVTDPTMKIVAIDQSFTLSGGNGEITIGEQVLKDSFFGVEVARSTVAFDLSGVDIQDPPGEVVQADQLVLSEPLQKVFVKKDILLTSNGGQVGATIIVQSFHQDNPDGGSTLLLLGGAFGGLALLRLRRKNS